MCSRRPRGTTARRAFPEPEHTGQKERSPPRPGPPSGVLPGALGERRGGAGRPGEPRLLRRLVLFFPWLRGVHGRLDGWKPAGVGRRPHGRLTPTRDGCPADGFAQGLDNAIEDLLWA